MKDVEVIKARNTLSPRARTNFEKRLRVAAYCRVSTDTEDQLNSYKSQVEYYTELIKSKPEWSLAGIYADEAITGTQVKKREDFQRLINDCMNGDVDMVITKSISRFARNTLDTLKYVRMLKDKGVAVFFEEENINTLTMDGELLLVILSSVAQQEVENISANVKKGLKMKMQRGELVGFQGCLGYDYNPEDKTLTVNEEEAAVVRYIFQRYTEGAGGSVIAKELENLGYKTKRGSPKWADSTVIGIIKNEKYKGDILLGKTFTVDPISKRRLYNFGEEDQFYIREHHEPIISEEVFEAAQEILRRRAKPRSLNVDGKREKFSRKYAFSCMIECGFCGGTLTRRSWHSSSQYNKAIWQCVVSTKKGKKFCPESKGVDERTIERAFVESYRLLCQNNKDVLDEFMKRTEEALSESNAGKRLAKAEKDIHALEVKKNKLVDMRLEDTIAKETYDRKYLDLSSQIEQLQKECESLQDAAETETTMRKRVNSCFSFQGKFFHFLTINRYGEIEYNLLYPASVFPFLREHLNSLDKGLHKLLLLRFRCGMVDFIKCQQQAIDIVTGNLLLLDAADLTLQFANLSFDFLYRIILLIIAALQVQNLSVIVDIVDVQGIHLTLQAAFRSKGLL